MTLFHRQVKILKDHIGEKDEEKGNILYGYSSVLHGFLWDSGQGIAG